MWLEAGYEVKISEMVGEDTIFVDGDLVVMHPFNYSYMSNNDIFVAHEINMLRIEARIDRMAEEAIDRLDVMVDEMNRKHDPRMVTFVPGVLVEDYDGDFAFSGTADSPIFDALDRQFVADYMKDYS